MKSKKLLLALLTAIAAVAGSATVFANTENVEIETPSVYEMSVATSSATELNGDSTVSEDLYKNATSTVSSTETTASKGNEINGQYLDKNTNSPELEDDSTVNENSDKNNTK